MNIHPFDRLRPIEFPSHETTDLRAELAKARAETVEWEKRARKAERLVEQLQRSLTRVFRGGEP